MAQAGGTSPSTITKQEPAMKIGLYSVTYRGVWYRGEAVDVFNLVRLAKQQGWEGVELDAERPHAAPMDLSADDRKRLRDLAGEVGIELCGGGPPKYVIFSVLPRSLAPRRWICRRMIGNDCAIWRARWGLSYVRCHRIAIFPVQCRSNARR